jgi:hypothetical protein
MSGNAMSSAAGDALGDVKALAADAGAVAGAEVLTDADGVPTAGALQAAIMAAITRGAR